MSTAPVGRVHGHLPVLDGIRGLAILVVLVHNVGYFDEPADSLALKLLRVAFDGGWTGVTLFFVLSGFLITGILLDTKESPHYFRSFYIRRVLRIFPLYYLTLAVAFVVLPHIVDLGEWGACARQVQIWYWTYLINWAGRDAVLGFQHFWSLAIEEQFYLVWPFVILALPTDRLMRLCGVLVASALVARLVMVGWRAPAGQVYEFTFTRWDALACGAAIAIAIRDPTRYTHLLTLLRRVALPAFIVLLLIIAFEHGLPRESVLMQTAGYSILAMLWSWLILAAIDPTVQFAWLRRRIAAPVLRFFGKYSYGMYVLHLPIHYLARIWLTGWVVADAAWVRPLRLLLYVAANLVVTTAAAVVVFHSVEKPFLSMKDRWARRE